MGGINAFLIKFKNYFHTNTLTVDGRPRIISLDIMRGISIFGMMVMNEISYFDKVIPKDGIFTM